MAKTELVAANFDYSICEPDEKGKLIRLEADVDRLKASGAELVFQLGQTLASAQGLLARHKKKVFLAWVAARGVSKSSAYRSIQVFRELGEHLPNLGKCEVSALYELAEKDVSEKARREVLKLAEQGEQITHARAKAIIKKHTQKSAGNGKPEPPASPPAPAVQPQPPVSETAEVVEDEPGPPPIAEWLDEEPAHEEDEPVEEAEDADPDSLESVQADLREFERRCRDLARYGRKVLGAEGNEIKRPWCGCYSILTLIHPLQHVARTVLNDLPVGGEPESPKLAHEQIAEREAG